MGMPAARMGDKVTAVDIHTVLVVTPAGTVPTPVPHPFSGTILGGTSATVSIGGMPAATVGSTATNLPPHVPLVPGNFQKPPANQGTIQKGSPTVLINGKPAARVGDPVMTCNDPIDQPVGQIVNGAPTVQIG